MNKLISAVMILCLAEISTLVKADMLTFDDITTTIWYELIPDGYGGVDWDNFNAIYGPSYPGTAYDWGRVSGDYTAYNGYGSPASISISSGTFDFNGAYLAPQDSWNVRVLGYREGALTHDNTVVLAAGSQWFDFNYMDIDELRFIPVYDGRFVMDNFTFNEPVVPIPVPGALVLGAIGLSFAGWRLKRKTV